MAEPKNEPTRLVEREGDESEVEEFRSRLEKLAGPIDGFKEDFMIMFTNAGKENRQKIQDLVSAYEQNVGVFFGKLFGDDDFVDIKMILTARDVWKKAFEKMSEGDAVFIWGRIKMDEHLLRVLPEAVREKVFARDFNLDTGTLLRLINTLANPDRSEDFVFIQRAFNEGIDPLGEIGGYHREEFAQRYPDIAPQLLAETKAAHHKGAMGIAFEASKLGKRGEVAFADLTPQEQVTVLWTNAAALSELYGDEVTTYPRQKWVSQVEPYTKLMGKVLRGQTDADTEEQLRALAAKTELDFNAFREEFRRIMSEGHVALESAALFQAVIRFEESKPGEVMKDAEHPIHDLFYADTQQYPYVTMSFQGERIGIQRVGKEGGRYGRGETSMSLPPEITSELFAQFPFLDKNQKITLRAVGSDFDIPVSGPSASYIYINEGTFFDEPNKEYAYTIGGETKTVTPREVLDFLRAKRMEFQS